MKKYWYYIVLILFCILLLPSFIRLFHKNHLIQYNLSKYKVEEEFFIEEKDHYYHFNITKDKNTYSFSVQNNFSRKKKVLSNILEYREGNVSCILPITKKKSTVNLVCLKDSKQVSNALLEDNSNYQKILTKAKEYIPYDRNDSYETYDQLDAYSNNIAPDEIFYIWNYKGVYILENNKISYQKVLDYDLYENIMATTVGKNYVLFDNSSVDGIDTVYCYNAKNKKVYDFKLDIKLEKDSYINGVRDNFIYVTDKRKKIQYKVDIVKGSIEEVGTEENFYITYINGERTLLNKSDFFMKNQLFDNDPKEINNEFYIYDNRYDYYYKNSMFQRMDSKKHNVSLFEMDDITEWGIQNHEILVLKEDTLYAYHDYYGLRKIVRYRELIYNYSNIYKLGR